MSDPVFVHCHIFKNAGTSVIESFRHAFHEKAIELEPADPDDYLSEELITDTLVNNPDVIFISSHRVRLPLPPVLNNRKIIPIIFFRDPIDRLGSVYRFEQKEARATVYAALAKAASMPAFFDTILDVGFDVIVSNVHAGFCSVSAVYTLEDAKKYLKNHALIGLVEDYHFSMALIEQEVKKYYPEISLSMFKENVTRSERDVLSNCTRTIEEIGFSLAGRIANKNDADYQLYKFSCNYLLDAWSVEENKSTYLRYCKTNEIENEHTDIRINSAPSLQCTGEDGQRSQKNYPKYKSAWARLKKYNAEPHKPIIEAVKLELFSEYKCLSIKSGQELSFDFKVRWPCALSYPAVKVMIKNHRETIVFNSNNFSFDVCNSGVDEGSCKIYRFKLTVPEVVSGLYKIDVQAGIGLGERFRMLTIAKAVSAFGIKSSISAGSDFVPVEAANSQIKCFLLN